MALLLASLEPSLTQGYPQLAHGSSFLVVAGSAMVRDRILVIRTGPMALLGLFLHYLKLTKVANYNFQRIWIVQSLIFLKISIHSSFLFFNIIVSSKFYPTSTVKKNLMLVKSNELSEWTIFKNMDFTKNAAFVRVCFCKKLGKNDLSNIPKEITLKAFAE